MSRRRAAGRLTRALLAGLAILGAATAMTAAADDGAPLSALRWLPPGSALGDSLAERPARRLRIEAAGGRLSQIAALGELAFRSPLLLGGDAGRLGLSCQVCHPQGHLNAAFFVPGLSDRPGNVDVSGRLFQAAADDDILNALNIPSLRDVAGRARLGHDGREASLRQFVRDVIVVEFAGDEPAPWLLDALLAYLRQLDRLPGADVDALGRTLPHAGTAARRGEAVFRRPFPGQAGLSCAACHRPDAGYRDELTHDVGSGGAYLTPGLFGLGRSAPYFHDGRYAGLRDVVAHFERFFDLAYDDRERDDLLAYLQAVGRAEQPDEAVTADLEVADVDRLLDNLALALRQEMPALGGFVAGSLRRELGRLYERYPGEANAAERRALIDLSRRLAAFGRLCEAGRFAAAREPAAEIRRDWPAVASGLRAAAGRSLYDPARRRALDAGSR